MVSLAHDTMDGNIQRIGAVQRESDPAGRSSAHYPRDGALRLLHQPVGFKRLGVAASPGRSAQLALVAIHCLIDAIRLGPGRGGVVEIDSIHVPYYHPPI